MFTELYVRLLQSSINLIKKTQKQTKSRMQIILSDLRNMVAREENTDRLLV